MRLRSLLLACAVALAVTAPAASAVDPANGGTAAPAKSVLKSDGGGADARPPAGPSGGAGLSTRPRKKVARAKKRKAAPVRKRARRRAPRRPAPPTPPAEPVEAGHAFPVAGAHDLGGKDARFGAKREGHSHQGQDIAAPEGTPVVAPWAGTVEHVRFQRKGAGWYIVLDGDGEDRDYVFMHLRTGSIVVAEGQRVSAGALLAQVGNTGSSTGPHLHFEIWVGGWYDGGEPIDPLPLLLQWLGG